MKLFLLFLFGPFIQNINISISNQFIKIIEMFYILFFTLSLNSSMYFELIAYVNLC